MNNLLFADHARWIVRTNNPLSGGRFPNPLLWGQITAGDDRDAFAVDAVHPRVPGFEINGSELIFVEAAARETAVTRLANTLI